MSKNSRAWRFSPFRLVHYTPGGHHPGDFVLGFVTVAYHYLVEQTGRPPTTVVIPEGRARWWVPLLLGPTALRTALPLLDWWERSSAPLAVAGRGSRIEVVDQADNAVVGHSGSWRPDLQHLARAGIPR